MVLAPQLRQSLEMLQLPILELQTVIQQELEQNPTLEEIGQDNAQVEIEPGSGELEKAEEMDFDKQFEALAKLDDEWRDYFFQQEDSGYQSGKDLNESHQYFLDSIAEQESLQEHLMAQLTFAGLSDEDRQIAELIIGSIDDDGYVTSDIEEMAATAEIDATRLADVLSLIQDFHPTGVGARNLKECLQLQLRRLGREGELEWNIVEHHLENLGRRRFQAVARALKVSQEEVIEAAQFIGTLDPRPGRLYTNEVANYVLPEVVVKKIDGEYVVILNDDQLPHLRISNHYRSLMRQDTTSKDVKSYIQERVRAGAFLIKSIHQRQKTIFRIASEIVRVQHEFLEQGIAHLRPITMAEIAREVGVHETTVSRAVSGKYMRTPKGVFEMKYFFTTGLKTADGGSVSNETIKDTLTHMVEEEDPTKPLSDQEILEKLKAQGIKIARRTIAKYRLMLRIPPSHLRKGL